MSDAAVRADAAKRLMEDPLLVELLDGIEEAAVQAWSATGMAQTEDRERAWHTLKAAQRVRLVLKGVVDNGQIEARRAVAPR